MPKRVVQISSKPVAIWLLVGVVMIIIQILLGGITRLTGSGLSITEWKPIMGALPPMRRTRHREVLVNESIRDGFADP